MLTSTEVTQRAIRFSVNETEVEVGWAWLFLIKNDLHTQPYGLLEDVWVDESYRNQGHAKTLVQAVIKRVKDENCYKLIATSRFEREKVHNLYKQLGFTPHGFEFRINL